jgi:hypothetical protein
MSKLPDGEYVLTERVTSPLPERLRTTRRGWMRAPYWLKGTHVTIKNGKWSFDRHYGYRDGADQLSDKQRRRVFIEVKSRLQPFAPVLPSHIVGRDAAEVLDFLFTTGKFTLDDAREALICHSIGDTIGTALSEFHAALPAAPPSQTPVAPGGLRVGDVIQDGNMKRYVATSAQHVNGEYEWQHEDTANYSFFDPFHANNETIVGHVADMLAEGLAALCADADADATVLGFDGAGNPVRAGDVLRSLEDPTDPDRFLVEAAANPDDHGPRVFFKRLKGCNPGFALISLQRGNKWRCEPASTPEHMPAPVTSRRDREPVDTASLFSLD